MSRTQIVLEPEAERLARQRASDLGMSISEYVTDLVARDLRGPQIPADLSFLFDLGASGCSDIAAAKDVLIGEAFASRSEHPSSPAEP